MAGHDRRRRAVGRAVAQAIRRQPARHRSASRCSSTARRSRSIGVMPPDVVLPSALGADERLDLILPLVLDRAAPRNRRGGHYLQAVGRLAPGATVGVGVERDERHPGSARCASIPISTIRATSASSYGRCATTGSVATRPILWTLCRNGRTRAAACLRQRRESAAGARRSPPSRDRRARSARRQPAPARAATRHRSPRAVDRRSGRRNRRRRPLPARSCLCSVRQPCHESIN